MKVWLILLSAFSVLWLGGSWLQYDLLTMSNCSYMQTAECRAQLKYVPQIIFWRWLSIELAAIVAFLIYRKR